MQRAELERELRAHHAAAFGWALACCRYAREQAEDVLQESYVRILDGRARFNGRAAFRTFVFGVIRNMARSARRQAALRAALTFGLLHEPGGPDPATEVAGPEAALRAALQQLSVRQRETLTLVFYHDLTIAEAATTLGISLGSARVHYERGKHALRGLLRLTDDDRR
jgi:RNA polymerase sigma factor (sigma-70 family)